MTEQNHTEEELKAMFDYIDTDESGYITKDELADLMELILSTSRYQAEEKAVVSFYMFLFLLF